MTAITFDTLAYSNKLQQAGMSREQADAMANAQADAMKELVAAQDLVTKHDLYIALSDTKHELLKWMMGMMAAQTALIVAAFGIGIAVLK
ncbi:MAG: CCDC90 family protein [Desulfovibrionaceae bacterium]|nr:CCDC90 family protein [Desulfovibrionaceae bacterium]